MVCGGALKRFGFKTIGKALGKTKRAYICRFVLTRIDWPYDELIGCGCLARGEALRHCQFEARGILSFSGSHLRGEWRVTRPDTDMMRYNFLA